MKNLGIRIREKTSRIRNAAMIYSLYFVIITGMYGKYLLFAIFFPSGDIAILKRNPVIGYRYRIRQQ
jgi:hypothetical protein